MIRRTLDATFLNAVANDPAVRPALGGEGAIDLTAVIADPANLALVTEHGGWVLHRHEPGTYELHTLFRPEGRGRGYFAAAALALDYVFARTDAREIVTRIPESNGAAGFAAARCGFRERFARERAWQGRERVSYQALDIDGWAGRSAAALAAGEAFHRQIEAAKRRFGSKLGEHPEDEAHDRAAGAAAMMIGAGNTAKGVWFYNRWARLAGYAPIAVKAAQPLVIDIGEGVIVSVAEGKMEVLACP